MSVIKTKLKEVLSSVLPITLIVIILHFTLTPIDSTMMIRFLIGAVMIIIGLTIFLFGVDIGITPIGNEMGSSIVKSNKISIVIIAGFILGFVINIAEPDLHILAGQVDEVTSGMIAKMLLVVVVSVGIGVLVSFGLNRIVFNIPLHKSFTVIYIIIFILAIFSTPEFIAIAFDASGATTGALTVPFLLAIATGVAKLNKKSKASEEDSFGLVGLASSGAILVVLVLSIVSNPGPLTGTLENSGSITTGILDPFFEQFPSISFEILIALSPILIIFLIFQVISFKLSKKAVRKILFGISFAFVGLVIFLVGVNAGFMRVGTVVGSQLAVMDNKIWVILVAFVLGMVTILAEPAVYVLTHQVEDVTSGYVKRKVVMFSLAIGVALAVALSIVRILVPGMQLWHFLLPGYVIAIIMSYFVPTLFVGIAFDSGGVASGPMTATFILAFAQGVANATESANLMTDGFGVIAMVAMTPLIALQILGLLFKARSKKGGIQDDES